MTYNEYVATFHIPYVSIKHYEKYQVVLGIVVDVSSCFVPQRSVGWILSVTDSKSCVSIQQYIVY